MTRPDKKDKKDRPQKCMYGNPKHTDHQSETILMGLIGKCLLSHLKVSNWMI